MKESINDQGSFFVKPGGTKEDASPTELGASEYSQVSGFDDLGATTRMPGKKLVTKYTDPIHQIAAFGGSVIIQHGSNLIMYPDACAVSPVPEEYSPPQPAFAWKANITNVAQISGVSLQLVGPCNQVLHDFGAVTTLPDVIDFTQYLPAAGGLFAWQVTVHIANQSTDQQYAATVTVDHATPTGHLQDASPNGYDFFHTDTNNLDVLMHIAYYVVVHN